MSEPLKLSPYESGQLYTVLSSYGDSNLNHTIAQDLGFSAAQELCGHEQRALGPDHSVWMEKQI